MTAVGVVLYGPATAGKDTVTAALAPLGYAPVAKAKCGPGRTDGYRMVDALSLDELRRTGRVLYESSRYDAVYALTADDVDDVVSTGAVPVVHMGQVAGIDALRRHPSVEWVTVLLWCPRHVCEERAAARGTGDVEARLQAWDETARDLDEHPGARWALRVHTDQLSPDQVAAAVDAVVRPVRQAAS